MNNLKTIGEETNYFLFAIFPCVTLRRFSYKKGFSLIFNKVWRDPSVIALVAQEGEL